MKTVKAICTAAILALSLSASVYAGEISSPGIQAPAPGDVQAPAAPSPPAGETETTVIVDILSALIWLL